MYETERKYLVDIPLLALPDTGAHLSQGYLSVHPSRTVRIRVINKSAFITIKGKTKGFTRAEYEYEIPGSDGKALLSLCLPSVIEKTRFKLPFADFLWEVDVFHGDNEGLVVAEIELPSEETIFEHPPWVGKEVTGDVRYFNSYLSQHPFNTW